jgi:peptide maturation system acyl carrier-related protein
MNNNDINKKLLSIFNKRFGIDFSCYTDEFFEKELLGNEINMQPRDLIYLFVDIQNEFGINIPQSFIAEGKFNTFSNIREMISSLY